MGKNDKTRIGWCDYSWNPWMGCTKVSPACAHCYAEREGDTRFGMVKWGPGGTRVVTSPDNWRKLARWNREAYRAPPWPSGRSAKPSLFVAPWADFFEDWHGPMLSHKKLEGENLVLKWIGERAYMKHVPYVEGESGLVTMGDMRERAFRLLSGLAFLRTLILTKRPENWHAMTPFYARSNPNIWYGVTAENQHCWNQRIPYFSEPPANHRNRFVSAEPLLGPIDISLYERQIKWIIVGCESGPCRRPTDIEWVRDLVRQCQFHGIAVFVKQLEIDGKVETDMRLFPEDLRIQEIPE